MKTILRWLARLFWGFRAFNTGALSAPGPVLLIPNHLSWFDWIFVGVCLDDDWRFVTSRTTAQTSWVHRWIMINGRTFPIDASSPYAVKHMAEYLQKGGRLVLFAEGHMSRTGSLMKLFDGTGFLLFKTKARVITAYIRGAGRLPCTPSPNKQKWFPRVTVHFSELLHPPIPEQVSTTQARRQLTGWLRNRMVGQQLEIETEFGERTLPEAMRRIAREFPRNRVLEDATRKTLTMRRVMLGADLLGRKLDSILPGDQQRIGVLLPNVSATPITLLALWFTGRIPAILNFSTGAATMLAGIQLAELGHIITSRTFLERAKLNIQPFLDAGLKMIYLEDVRSEISSSEKLAGLLRQFLALRPSTDPRPSDSTAVILFTSGSEGMPKAVELTHGNLLANIRQMLAIIDFTDEDRFFNCLPLFHSFGLTIGTLLPLLRGNYTFLYPSPLHYRMVPAAFYDRSCTVLLSTNTFLNGYARKADSYDFRSLRYLFAGAEKVQQSTAKVWSERFGVRILEGYGATECSPCLSVNTPLEVKFGTAGKLLPGMEYRLEPVEGVSEGGQLWVRGPNVMKGYLNPDANEEFKALGGWYDTGDVVSVDEDRFVRILGRLKRFAKISGEMVSLTAVEEALAGAFPQFGQRFQIAVVSRPDPDKGEALIAVSNEPKLKIEAIRGVIREKGFSNLYVPRELKVLREIPKLGTGKVNLRELQRILE